MAPLLPKLRGHFAEFLNNASSVGLRIFSSSTCVGLRYGPMTNNSGFSRQSLHVLHYFYFATFGLWIPAAVLPAAIRLPSSGLSIPGSHSFACVPTVLLPSGTGISACCPSTTTLVLALGPDLPRADQLYPGNLRYSAERILTFLSLLIPAFSLLNNPQLLPVLLLLIKNAPLPMYCYIPRLRCRVSAPVHFRRRTSRLVSCYALFECLAASEPTS